MNLPRNIVIGIWIGLIFVVLCGTMYLNLFDLGNAFRLGTITGYEIFAGVATTVNVLLPPGMANLTAWLEGYGIGNYIPGDVTLNWSPDNYPYLIAPVSDYNIYMSDNYTTGFNFNIPNLTLPNTATNYTDINAYPVPERYYVLRADNPSPLKDVNTDTWGKFDINLINTSVNNLNLASIPMIPANKSFSKVIVQNVSNFYIYQISTRNDTTGAWYTADYLGGFGINAWFGSPTYFTTMEPDEAYWIKSRYNKIFTLVGQVAIENRSVQVINTSVNNLNLVGWTSVDKQNFATAIRQNPSNFYIYQISTRNDTTGAWYTADYLGGFGINAWFGSPTYFTSFEPGHGYWIKSRYNTVWNYKPNQVTWK